MPITINGSGTVTGISAGGLPDGVITRPEMGYAGAVLQVVSATKTDTASINSLTWADITGLSVSITPTAASNKILIIYNAFSGWRINVSSVQIRIVRDSTALCIGDAASNRPRVSSTNYSTEYGAPVTDVGIGMQGNLFLDSPNSTSSLTYKLQFAASTTGGASYINRTVADRDTAGYDARAASTITVMEVAA